MHDPREVRGTLAGRPPESARAVADGARGVAAAHGGEDGDVELVVRSHL